MGDSESPPAALPARRASHGGQMTSGVLACPVRGCGLDLTIDAAARRAGCPRGHSFDRARSGYWNLLQPQDRRSLQAGDDRETSLARRRLFAAGHLQPLVVALRRLVEELPASAAALDVGCGEGSLLDALAEGRELDAHGTDLSTPAIDLAARAFPAATWTVANADRALPYRDGAFALALSVTARLHPGELRRIAAPGGRLAVVVPGPDDLVELRAALLGRGDLRERLSRSLALLAAGFEVEETRSLRWRARLDDAAVADVLASGYRAARGRAERAAELPGLDRGLEVTMSRDLAVLRRRH